MYDLFFAKLCMCRRWLTRDLDQFPLKNRGVTPDDDDDDFEIPELHDLLKAVDQKKNERKECGVITDGHHELTERERHDVLVAAWKIRNERLQSQKMSPELALVNGDRAENSRNVTPGDSQGLLDLHSSSSVALILVTRESDHF